MAQEAVRLWNVLTGAHRIVGESRGRAIGLTVSRDGKRLASMDGRGELRIWDVASGASTVLFTEVALHSGL